MGIQVISTTLQAATANAAASSAPAADGASGFSDLLALQMQAPTLAIPSVDALATDEKTQVGSEENAADAALNAALPDPSVVAQTLAWFPAQQAPASPVPTTTAKDFPDFTASSTAVDGNGKSAALAPLSADTKDSALSSKTEGVATTSEEQSFNRILGETGNRDKTAANLADKPGDAPNTAALTAHALQTQATKQTEATSNTTAVQTPLHEGRWATDFGQKIVWMAKADQQDAQININPPELGPVQITLNLKGENATASFASPHAEVRQAIETAMPRLREMMAEAGIALGQTNVGSQFAQQTPQQNRQPPSDSPRFAVDNAILSSQTGVAASATVGASRGQGLVDLFA